MAVAEIADILSLTPGTAKVMLQRVFQKVGVGRHAELVARFATLARLGTLDASGLLDLMNQMPGQTILIAVRGRLSHVCGEHWRPV